MRLVIVSNRVTIPDRSEKVAAGGLAVALREALEKHGGLWFGWSWHVSEEKTRAVRTLQRGKVTYAVTDLSEEERQTYYLGFSNRALWPNMHYRLGLTEFSRADYAGYLTVNRRFAKALVAMLRPDDLIWVHDYHLIPLAAELRRLGVKNRIGYFHHIPWPPSEVFGALPSSITLMKTVGAYDLVGLQTEIDARNVVSGLVNLCGAKAEGVGVRLGRRSIKVKAFPIGIDVEGFRKLATSSARTTAVSIRRATEAFGDRKLVIGVDRLDYSKGIVQRLEAFERFLLENPEQRGRVGMLQIAPPSRSDVPEYAELDRQSDETAGRINAALGEFDWTPIRVVKKAYSRNVLAGFYRRAEVGLVTPMRDGMNLVAKEYIAAQDPADPGVLVLSRFAGAARQMKDALIVNPYDLSEMSEAIQQALVMPKPERIRRFEKLYATIAATDIGWWTETYLAALSEGEAGFPVTRPAAKRAVRAKPATGAKRRPATSRAPAKSASGVATTVPTLSDLSQITAGNGRLPH